MWFGVRVPGLAPSTGMQILRALWHSIRGLRILMVVGILAAYLLAIYVVYRIVERYYDPSHPQSEPSARRDVTLRANALTDLLDQLHTSVQTLAAEQSVRELVAFGYTMDMQDWAIGVRRFVPGSLGVALFDVDGTLVGQANDLRVGPSCEADVGRLVAGKVLPWPIVHRDLPGLEHFDMIAPIPDASHPNEGFLFMSFRLSLVERWIKPFTQDGERVEIIEHSGRTVAASGSIRTGATAFTAPLGDSQFALRIHKVVADADSLARQLTLFKTAFFVLIVIVPLAISARIWKLMRADLERIRTTLLDVREGRHQSSDAPSHLLETRAAMSDIEHLAAQLSQLQARLSYEAQHDPLTRLPNRRYLEEMLIHICGMVERGAGFHLVILDLDHFRKVNDRRGHQGGDQMLIHFAGCLRRNLRTGDFAARYAGDEFVLLLYEASPPEHSTAMLERLMDRFAQKQREEQPGEPITTLSMGSFHMSPGTRVTPETAIGNADKALFAAKRQGRNRIVDFSTIDAGAA